MADIIVDVSAPRNDVEMVPVKDPRPANESRRDSRATTRNGRTVSLRSLFVGFAGVLVVVVGIASVLPMSLYWNKSIKSLSNVARGTVQGHLDTYRSTVLGGAIDQLTELLAIPVTITEMGRRYLQPLDLTHRNLSGANGAEKELHAIFYSMTSNDWPYVLAIQLGWQNVWNCRHVFRRLATVDAVGLQDACQTPNFTYFFYDPATRLPTKEILSNVPGLDVRTRPWYRNAHDPSAVLNETVWVRPYYSLTPGEGSITSVSMVDIGTVNVSAEVGVVLSVAMKTKALTDYMETLKHTPRGWSMLVEGPELNVIASSNASFVPDTTRPSPALSSLWAPIREVAQAWIDSNYSEHFTLPSSVDTLVDSALIPVRGGGLSVRLFLITPKDDFLGPVIAANEGAVAEANNTLSVVIVVVVVVLAISLGIGMFVAVWLSKPLKYVCKQLSAIANMDFDDEGKAQETHRSSVAEINSLLFEANRMGKALDSFGKYVPKVVVKHLIRQQLSAQVGVTKAHATLLFLDIAEFTKAMSVHGPQVVIEILATLFDEFSAILVNNGGVIDKFIGDAIMCFWGCPDPIDIPVPRAVKAVEEITAALVRLNVGIQKRYGFRMQVRIGIHSGEVHAGNVGCALRLNYTVLGDTVNLAARLEPLNKVRTRVLPNEIIISWHQHSDDICHDRNSEPLFVTDEVRKLAGAEWSWRCVGLVEVRGFSELVRVHEYIGRTSDLNAEQCKLLRDYRPIDEALLEGKENGAVMELLTVYVNEHKDDVAAAKYLGRCKSKQTIEITTSIY